MVEERLVNIPYKGYHGITIELYTGRAISRDLMYRFPLYSPR
jgi:hypothetical protein